MPRAYMFGIEITYSVVSPLNLMLVIKIGGEQTTVLRPAIQDDSVLALHVRRDGVTEELGLGPKLTDDGELVCG
jgi:hypothetical protein